MTRIQLDRLRRLPPREAWPNEATDFTPWLASEDNFDILAETLHLIDAEVEITEHGIGSFSADILARDQDGYVLVENQLEQTDHTHLGQILTYLAGLEGPVKVIWISTKVRDEHRAAVDWLNAHTPDEFSFFAVEIELLQIATSPAAPIFHVVAKPNEWSRHVAKRSRQVSEAANSERQQWYLRFWEGLAEYRARHDPSYRPRTPSKNVLWTFSVGKAEFYINLYANLNDNRINTTLGCKTDVDRLAFDDLLSQQEDIEAEFGEPLIWNRNDENVHWHIVIERLDIDLNDEGRWEEYYAWYSDKLGKFRRTFAHRIKQTNPARRIESPDSSEDDDT